MSDTCGLTSGVESNVAQFGITGLVRPCHFARDAEHCRDGVIPKRDDGLLVLPAGAGNVDDAVDERVGRGSLSHPGTSEPQMRGPQKRGRLRKGKTPQYSR